MIVVALLATALQVVVQTERAGADADAPLDLGCDAVTLATESEAISDEITLPFALDIGDVDPDNTVYVSENGLLTFGAPIAEWRDVFSLAELSNGDFEITNDNELIAPLFANAIQGDASSVTYGPATYQGRDAFCVEWTNLEPDNTQGSVVLPDPVPMNTFELVLVERFDRAAGDFDIIVNYEKVEWDDSQCIGRVINPPDIDAGLDADANVELQQIGCCVDIEFEGECCEFNPNLCEFEIGVGRAAHRRQVEIASVFEPQDAVAGLAGISFPESLFDNGRVVDFPGSGRIDAMIGPDGLAGNSLNSLQAGRYVIEVEGGLQTDVGEVIGNVVDDSDPAVPVPGAIITICTDLADGDDRPFDCAFSRADDQGTYTLSGVPFGDYQITARAPAGVNLRDSSVLVSVTFPGQRTAPTIVMESPTPPAPNVDFGPTRDWGENTTIYWNDDLNLSVSGCAGGTATWSIVASEGPEVPGGPLVEGPDGTYSTTIPPLFPTHGDATISMVIDCPGDGIPDETTDFDLYIDPSGVVQEVHSREPIENVTVVLERRDPGEIDFTVVPDGSDIMSPDNRVNPFQTDVDGLFGWDVIAGEYRVTVSKDGCDDLPLPADWVDRVLDNTSDIVGVPDASATPILTVLPEWLGLELFVDCNNAPEFIDPGAVTLEAPATAADLTEPPATDLDPTDTLTIANDAPAMFPLGDTVVTWTVVDDDGAMGTLAQTITVVDMTPPVLTLPGTVVGVALDMSGAVLTFEATAFDNEEMAAVDVTCVPPSGSTFALGSTEVTCSATDASSNDATDSFEVFVVLTPPTPVPSPTPLPTATPVPGASMASCVDGKGQVSVRVENNTGATASYRVVIRNRASLGQLDDGALRDVVISGIFDGTYQVDVELNGVVQTSTTVTVQCGFSPTPVPTVTPTPVAQSPTPTPSALDPIPTAPVEVTHVVSCLAGNGRVDTNIVNTGADVATYGIEFEGLSLRALDVDPADWWRMPITGRPDGDYAVTVKRDGLVASTTTVTVLCDAAVPDVSDTQAQIVNACRADRGYLLFQFVNESDVTAGYVIEFENVPNRSTSAAPFGQSIRAVTGRPDGTYQYFIRRNGEPFAGGEVIVDCLP